MISIRHTAATAITGLALVGSLSACDSFVNDVDPLITDVVSDSLDNQSQVQFAATGVKQSFNDAYDQLSLLADLLADVGQFNQKVLNSTFPTYGDIDRAEITLDNNSVRNAYTSLNEYRYQADDLTRRANETITFSADDEGAESKRLALFTGNLHGGISRYFLGSYFGVEPAVGGAPISDDPENPTARIPTAELYAQAITKYMAALASAGTDAERRVVNTLIARTYLFLGDRAQAATFAAQGMTQTDEPYLARYATTSSNDWWNSAGRGRTQVSIAPRFNAYQMAGDTRTPVEVTPKTTAAAGDPATFYRQALYLDQADPIPFVSWQENALIRAEAALLGTGGAAVALPFVNLVRLDAGVAPLVTLDQAALIQERDKTLFTQGQRLIDERRFNIFHTTTVNETGTVALGPWRFLPVPTDERDSNPNL